jgi:outer membrane biosynthesis protein TonB
VTTSEFIIGHSVDDATEKKAEVRKILWALLAALAIHLIIGTTIAAFHDVLFTRAEPMEEDKPVELTIVGLSASAPTSTPTPPDLPLVNQDESRQSAEKPKEKNFQSNVDSVAASEHPATGETPVPSHEGKERSWVDLETHDYSVGNPGTRPQPSAAPEQTPQPSAVPEFTPVSEAEQFAMLTGTPRPTAEPKFTPKPSQGYRSLSDGRASGSISNRGISSVNAMGTPLGRYQKQSNDAIGSHWYAYMEQKRELAGIGTLHAHFFIDRDGRVKDLKITENTSNEAFANICLQSVLEAHFQPIPEDLANTLPPEGLEMDETFILFPN